MTARSRRTESTMAGEVHAALDRAMALGGLLLPDHRKHVGGTTDGATVAEHLSDLSVEAPSVTREGVQGLRARRRVRQVVTAAAGPGAVLALAALRFALPAGTPPIRSSGPSGTARAVAALEKVSIGGSEQWILIRSQDVRNPVVLFLHGGPGTSQLTSNRRGTRELERFFTVVNWDQRGAGKSYAAIADTGRMTIDQFVEDTGELTRHLLARFHQDRLVLVGHSWGSIIGALTVARHPDLFSCYVGIGQVADMAGGEAASYRWTVEQARRHHDRRAVAALARIGPPPYRGDWQRAVVTQRRLLGRFGGEVHDSRTGALGLVLRGLVCSREYTLGDRINFFRGVMGSMELLWPELLEVNLRETVPELRVPVFFVEGRHDHEAPAELAEQYFDALAAPSKELVWFEDSAHLPHAEERDRFTRFMVERVRPVATRHDGL
ncbi:alpha/beta fold hydrolase [uncultured Kocuria sp.]|uniref:alpha/beta fold hydrolase n=1 Tax=uncultured Kocuria sp. TaxID=259305 RepID=UPI00263360DB|nr:alpha/beta hydrolase [uncultured Kocuria sp.]